MTAEFKTPEMLGSESQEIRKVLSYLYQLANQLNYVFSVMDNIYGLPEEGAESSPNATRSLLNKKISELTEKIDDNKGKLDEIFRAITIVGPNVSIGSADFGSASIDEASIDRSSISEASIGSASVNSATIGSADIRSLLVSGETIEAIVRRIIEEEAKKDDEPEG